MSGNEAFREHSSFAHYSVAVVVLFLCTPTLYIIIYLKLKSRKIPSEKPNNAQQQRAKRERNVLKLVIATVITFAARVLPLSTYIAIIVWGRFESLTVSWYFPLLLPMTSYDFLKLCNKSLC